MAHQGAEGDRVQEGGEDGLKLKKALFVGLPVVAAIAVGLAYSNRPGEYAKGGERKFCFAVLADPLVFEKEWEKALTEVRDRNTAAEPSFDPAEFVLVAGDVAPMAERYLDFKEVFSGSTHMRALFPVDGNHDHGSSKRYMVETLIPAYEGIVPRDKLHVNYHVDYKNVRLIVVDGYSDLGKLGVINADGLKWVQGLIESAPEEIEHIFVSFHEPAFPRYSHERDSFNSSPEDRNAFWNMLVAHRDRVRAVFVGHCHFYYRMRVRDPAGEAPNDAKKFSDEEGGVYQVCVPAAGSSRECGLVLVQVYGDRVMFRVLEVDRKDPKKFNVEDEWEAK